MSPSHLKILTHFNRACDELKAAEKMLSDIQESLHPLHNRDNHFLMQFSKDVVIEINRIEYLIRQEIKRREMEMKQKNSRQIKKEHINDAPFL